MMLMTSVSAFTSPRHEAFLSAAPADEEAMGPNMNFSPISTTMACTINLTLQYMVIFTALGVCRTYLEFKGLRYSSSVIQTTLKHASDTVFYAPMVCIMFIGFRMRVLQLSKGTGNPQDWVRFAMQSVAYSILANTLLVLVIPVFTSTSVEVGERGELKLDGANPFDQKKTAAPAAPAAPKVDVAKLKKEKADIEKKQKKMDLIDANGEPNAALAQELKAKMDAIDAKIEAAEKVVEAPPAAEPTNPFENRIMAIIFTVIRYFAFLGLYVGFGAVCVGVFLYEPEAGVWEGDIPPLSPAVACTMILSTAFFFVYFIHAASRTWTQFAGGAKNTDFEETMERAADTMALAPMFCVLFLGARMRALQMDPVGGNPQKWAQNCFFACTYCIMFQTLLAVAVKFLLPGVKVVKGDVEGDMKYEGLEENSWSAKFMTVFRFIIMLGVYVGGAAVVCSVFTIEHPDGKEHTPPISPTMQCVFNLAFQYFLIYLLLWIFHTIKDFWGDGEYLAKAENAIQSAKGTVQFAPMLSVLFIATRMRALQITKNMGSPQGWVQDGMYLATWSILIQFLMCLIMPFVTGKAYTPDTLDNEEKDEKTEKEEKAWKESNPWAGYFVTFVRYAALIALIGGVATVITGVFMMTPENANGRGSIPLITDGTLPVDLAPAPPGVNDIPGANSAMKATGETVGAGVDVAAAGTDAVTSPVTDVAAAGAETVTG